MKILKTIPTGDNLPHDGQLLRIVRLALPAFIIISSITDFGGVSSYLSDYLIGSHWFTTYSLYGAGYVFFSLAPDVLNAVAMGYIARSIIKGHIRDRLCMFLVFFCFALVIPLTRYSYKMSKVSASALVEDAAPVVEAPDLAPVDDLYQAEISRISADYDQEKQSIDKQYQTKLEAVRAPYIARIEAKQQLVERYERNRKPSNTEWTDKKIVEVREQIAKIESDKAKADIPLLTQKLAVLSDLKAQRDQLTSEARKIRLDDRAAVKNDNQDKRSKVEEITTVIDRQFSGIAGYAVFVVLLLTIVLEVLEYRNGIKHQFVFTLFDAGINPITEVLGYPLTAIGRSIINTTRRKYDQLEEMSDAVTTKVKFNFPDAGSPDQKQPVPTTKKRSTRRRPARAQTKKNTPINLLAGLRSKTIQNTNTNQGSEARTKIEESGSTIHGYDSGVTFTAHEKNTNDLTLADLRQRLRMYKKRLAKHTQIKVKHEKAGTPTPTRTLNAIRNNASWVAHYKQEMEKFSIENN